MKEQRTQAYLTLINQLLSCKEGNESQILQENRELVDQGLIEVMIAVAQQLEEAGGEKEAQWLLTIAQQLAQALGLLEDDKTATTNSPQDYLDFLIEALQRVAENPNPQVIYPFLEQNIDKLDERLIEILQYWAKKTLLSSSVEESVYIANTVIYFSDLIQQFSLGNIGINLEIAITGYQISLNVFTYDLFPKKMAVAYNNLGITYYKRIKGDKAENLEKAISAYNEALRVYTLDEFPQNWAGTQINLATTYLDRIREDKAENLEKAITAYKEALKVYTFDKFSQQWAKIHNTLGNLYSDRIKGDKAENLEKAISAYNEALRVYTFAEFPQQWGDTQNNLAIAYFDRIKESRAENLEKAISAYNEALRVYTFNEFPQQWAITQNNLGNTYSSRIKENKAENIEKAILFFTEALKVRTFKAFPEDWAMTQNNLAIAYVDRISGDKADNLERAIFHYNEALKVRTFEAFPEDCATTQNNLGNAYFSRIRGDQADNLEKAITAYNEALKIYTFKAFPKDWAMTQNNLALAYTDRIRGDKADNLEKAIMAYTEALKVRTFEAFPEKWSMTQHNLGKAYIVQAYLDGIKGDKADNVEKAIMAYTEALKVRTFEVFPQFWAMTHNNIGNTYALKRIMKKTKGDEAEDEEKVKAIFSYENALRIYTVEDHPLNCLNTARSLANIHYQEKEWQVATETYHIAIEAVENARLEALNPQSRQEVLSNAIDVFHRIVQSHLNLNQPEKALEYIERSKGRNLVELMTQKGLKPQNVSQKTIDKLAELKQQVVNEQIRLQHQSINRNLMREDNLSPQVQDYSYLQEYQQALDTFITEKITPYDSTFSLTQKVQPIPFKDIQALTDASTCLLQWYLTDEKILAFIVSANETVKVWQSSETDLQDFSQTINDYLKLHQQRTWVQKLPDLLEQFAKILHINEIISLIPETCQRLVIIPHRFLHILPLHVLPINSSPLFKGGKGGSKSLSKEGKGSILQDKYDIQYAPSCQLLQITKQHPLNELTKLFAVQNPTQDLMNTDLEVKMISNLFNETEIIAKDKATENTVTTRIKASDSHCYHFACHGGFNSNNPLESALILTKEKDDKEDGYLTLGEIFELDLRKARLVVLSACETGLIDLNSISDEYIGLPAGFLFAGSSSVVSSLWTVDDLSTALLMIKFYQILLAEKEKISVAIALKQAQNWLKNLTHEEYQSFKTEVQKPDSQLERLVRDLDSRKAIYDGISETNQEKSPYPYESPYYWAGFTAAGI